MKAISIDEVLEYVEGTCLSVDAIIERFELDMDIYDLEFALLDAGLERCPGCDWWMESHELLDDDSEVVGCDQCRDPCDADKLGVLFEQKGK